MISWTFALLLFALASGFAGFAPVPSFALPPPGTCENEAQSGNSAQSAQITPVDLYMRLVEVGLSDQSLSRTDLEWTMQQSTSTLPFPNGRSFKNLQLHKGFRRVLHALDSGDWPNVVKKIREHLDLKAEQDEKVAEARELTKPLVPWIDLHEMPSSHFVARNGDTFFQVNGDDGKKYIHFLQNKTSHTLHQHNGWRRDETQFSYYEALDGTVYHVSYNSAAFLTVTNVRTGAHLGRQIILHHRHQTFVNQSKFLPLLFEVNEGLIFKKRKLKIALVRSFPNLAASESTPIPIVDHESGKIKIQELPGGRFVYRRMSDGNLYAYGLSVEPENSTFAVIHNISLNRTVFRNEILTSHMDRLKHPTLYLDESGQPGLLFTGREMNIMNSPVDTSLVKPKGNFWAEFKTLPALNGIKRIHTFNTSSGEPAVAGVLHHDEANSELVIRFAGDNSVRRVKIPYLDSHQTEVVETPKGPLIISRSMDPASTEWNVEWTHIHIYKPESGELRSVPLITRHPYSAFYLPSEGKLFTLELINSNVQLVPLLRGAP